MATEHAPGISLEELQLATRNHGMPLEALRYDVTPIGLHYLLIHYDIPVIDPQVWRLRVGGRVENAAQYAIDELKAMPATTRVATMECAGNGRALLDPRPVSQPWLLEAVGTGEWTGVLLADVLRVARVRTDGREVLFTGGDRGFEGGHEQRYQRALTLDDALDSGALLAYSLNGSPLPPQHGFPLRLVVPCWYGMTNVKWLTDITVLDHEFTGYQQARAYRLRQTADDDGTPVTRMMPRSLMVPPGVPDFFTRTRSQHPGPCRLSGRAWSGQAEIVTVEVTTDGGTTWSPAVLSGAGDGHGAWREWSFEWDASLGDHVLGCRATDAAGNEQATTPSWNLGGYTNNAMQRVAVHVAD